MCSHLGFTVQVTSTMNFVLRMNSRSKLIAMIAAFGTLAGLIATGCGTVRAGYESAPYKEVRSEGQFELRDYPVLTVVETPMARDSNGSGGSFNRLFRFITSGNEANQKIPMTTPVFMSGGDTNANMAFVMPAKMKTGEVPNIAAGLWLLRPTVDTCLPAPQRSDGTD